MKSKIIFLAAALAFIVNFSACSAGRHHKDDANTTTQHHDVQDHKQDNAPR